MLCDQRTMKSLSIFLQERHPGSVTLAKEGLSIFSIFNFTKTTMGAKILRSWLMNPTRDRGIIDTRQRQISLLLDNKSDGLLEEVRLALNGMKDIGKLLRKFYMVSAKPSDWKSLFDVSSIKFSFYILLTLKNFISLYKN